MATTNGPLIDLLYVRGPLSTGAIAANLGNGVSDDEVEIQLLDMQARGLVEVWPATPRRWQLTENGAKDGWERKARSSP